MNDLVWFLLVGGVVFLSFLLLGMRARLRRVERKLTLLLRFMQVDLSQPISLSPAVQELARSGKKIEAIKAHRKETGVGLAEAKEAVEGFLSKT